MEAIAVEYLKDQNFPLLFFYVDSEDGIIQSLRTFAKLPSETPLLAIVDIPNQVKYVLDDKVSEESVHKMIADYQANSLHGSSLKQ